MTRGTHSGEHGGPAGRPVATGEVGVRGSGTSGAASATRSWSPTISAIDAGLVLPGDVHPSAQGQQLLADAVTAAVGD